MTIKEQQTETWIRERRRGLRVALGTHASISGGSTKAAALKMVVLNVSESGIRLEGCAQLNVGYYYSLQLLLPTGKTVKGLAKIVWKNPEPYIQTYGAELVPVSWWEKAKLSMFIHHSAGNIDPNLYWKAGVGLVTGAIILKSFWSVAAFGWPAVAFTVAMLSLYLTFAKFARHNH